MIIDEIWFYVAIAVLLAIAVFLFFLQSRYQRDAFELSQDLAKAQADLSQINQNLSNFLLKKSDRTMGNSV
ncbi:DNA recombination protein RmuC-like protein [Actinobacillus equuli]|nr:DNA recombination protein RmuC-like protein [Actinobacillus equuli]